MSSKPLNKDVLLLILEELQDDIKSVCSCLLVNKTWCEVAVPIIWKNPWKNLNEKNKKLQLNVIISHLSNKTKEELSNKGISLFAEVQQNPTFNYIGFCKYLDLCELSKTILTINLDESKVPMIREKIFDLFFNRNTKYSYLSIPSGFNCKIHLNSGAEYGLSELKILKFSSKINQRILKSLVKTSKSIKELELTIKSTNINNSVIIPLIEAQRNLNNVHLISHTKTRDVPFYKILEKSLMKHANTIQYLKMGWQPITEILSSLINLVSLELSLELSSVHSMSWTYLENLHLPTLKFLKAQSIPSKILANLIENTKGQLTEISIHLQSDNTNNKKLVQAIHQNSPNLRYLKLWLIEDIILEFELLLINCQYLDGLVVVIDKEEFDWDKLFGALTKLSPTSLFKLKFYYYFENKPKIETLKLFLDNWKGRCPMLLQTFQFDVPSNVDEYFELFNLFEKYKTKGIVKKCDNSYFEEFEDFE